MNANLIADQRHIETRTVIAADQGEDRIAIELHAKDALHRVEGAIYADGSPRTTHLDGYSLDMVPSGHMVLLTNADVPGRIGLVGKLFGDANVNIAEMVIGRKPVADAKGSPRGQVAMMILKVDEVPPPDLLAKLRRAEGILSVAAVELP